MIQHCDVYINILCVEEDKLDISEWLRDYFNNDNHLFINKVPLDYLEIVDDAKGLIVLDLEVDVPCNSQSESGYTYFEDFFDETTFVTWIKEILPSQFDVEIEIDKDSCIPTEEKLVEEYKEELENYFCND